MSAGSGTKQAQRRFITEGSNLSSWRWTPLLEAKINGGARPHGRSPQRHGRWRERRPGHFGKQGRGLMEGVCVLR